MKRLNVREIRGQLPQLDRLLSREGEVLVTRRGKAIARLLPVGTRAGMPSHADLRARMPRLKTGSERLVRAERDER